LICLKVDQMIITDSAEKFLYISSLMSYGFMKYKYSLHPKVSLIPKIL